MLTLRGRAMGVYNLLNQTEFWVNRAGEKVPLVEMSCAYKATVRDFILRRARHYSKLYFLGATISHYDPEWGPGHWSMADPTTPDGQEWLVKRVGEEQWLRETALVRELLYQSRASLYDGPRG